MISIDMDYRKHYDRLIDRAKNRTILSGEYFEKHHIVPRCMEGTDDLENIVRLFPEEHYLAHLLLIKIYPNEPKLVLAARYMTNGNKKNGGRTNNRMYGWVKRAFSKAMSDLNIGRKQSAETIEKRTKSLRGRVNGPLSEESIRKRTETRKLNGVKQKPPPTQETKDKISKTLRDKNNSKKINKEEKVKKKRILSQEQKDHLSMMNTGKLRGPCPPETKDKISKANIGRKRSEESCNRIRESLQNLPLHICPHCGKESRTGVIFRWHFDNCKSITHKHLL